ncbi:MAG: hypothetical protein CMJ78_09650 [Planctomycetaceae bacterium]|nr:hypothetical protein [Planctomycetaceae bacterium]
MLVGVVSLSGCGYTVASSFPEEVRTIEVPIFATGTFRRGLEFQLTEAVHKEIQRRTHFRLVKGGTGDTRLIGRIVDARKNVLGETAADDPRDLQLGISVEVEWQDLRTGRRLAQDSIAVPEELAQYFSVSSFAPEVGASLATAQQQAIDDLARQIVNAMESPW